MVMNARFTLSAALATLCLALPVAAQELAPGTLQAPGPSGAIPAGPRVADAPAPTMDVVAAEAALRGWFDGFEFVPTPTHFARLGPALAPALLKIARDPAAHPAVRARAISSMVHVRDPATANYVAGLLESPDAESVLRRKAAQVIAERQGTAAIDRLASAMVNAADDVFLREACARGLRAIGPASEPARDALLRTETAPSVRGLLLRDKRIGMD